MPVGILELKWMGGLDLGLALERLHPGGMVEDRTELGLVSLQLLFAQVEAGETGNVGNVDFYRHERASVGSPSENLGEDRGESVVRPAEIVEGDRLARLVGEGRLPRTEVDRRYAPFRHLRHIGPALLVG